MAIYRGQEIDLRAPEAVVQGFAPPEGASEGVKQRLTTLTQGRELEPIAVSRLQRLVDGSEEWATAFGEQGKIWINSKALEIASIEEATAGYRGKDASTVVQKATHGVFKAVDATAEGERFFEAIVSTNAVDRYGDIVEVKGIDFQNYLKNPVILYNHNYYLPIARCTGIEVKGNKMTARGVFPPEGTDADADKVYAKMKAGLLNAVSIGFIPDWENAEAIDKEHPWDGIRFKAGEMVEFSIVTIPANAQAMITDKALEGETEGNVLRHIPSVEDEQAPPEAAEGTEVERDAGAGETTSENNDEGANNPACQERSVHVESESVSVTRLREIELRRRRATAA